MVDQLLKYTSPTNIHILDNNSTYPPIIEYLKSIESSINIHRFEINYGHSVVTKIPSLINSSMYIITDPDLTLNANLPQTFINDLVHISNKYQVHKVGFALDNINNIRSDISFAGKIPSEWESQFWKHPIPDINYTLYNAQIDTTFCLINNRFMNNNHIRVAGNFTCIHRPWLINWKDELPADELEYYKRNNISSTWIN